jgi:hypothetical protein
MGPEGVTLKNHTGIPFVGSQVRDVAVTYVNGSVVRDIKPGKATQQGGFSTSTGPEKEKYFAGMDV